MATKAIIFTIIFSLFALSQARTNLDLPENIETKWIPDTALPESDDSKSIIVLPSEKLKSESLPFEMAGPEGPEADVNHDLPLEKEFASESDTITAIGITRPLKITFDLDFRPVNRHFHHRQMDQPLKFRFPHRCRHHGKPTFGPEISKIEIPYGDDMIQSEKPFLPVHHEDVGQIPARKMKFPGEMRRFPMRPGRVNGGSMNEKVKFDWLRGMDEVEEKEEREERGGLLERFWKFLNHV